MEKEPIKLCFGPQENFNLDAEFEAEIQPLLKPLFEKLLALGIPAVFIATSKAEEDGHAARGFCVNLDTDKAPDDLKIAHKYGHYGMDTGCMHLIFRVHERLKNAKGNEGPTDQEIFSAIDELGRKGVQKDTGLPSDIDGLLKILQSKLGDSLQQEHDPIKAKLLAPPDKKKLH